MDKAEEIQRGSLNRRAFIGQGTLFLAGSTLVGRNGFALAEGTEKPKVRIGLVTDLHYADKPPVGTRHYRETPAKLAEAAKRFEQEKVDCVIALGDMIDSADSLDVVGQKRSYYSFDLNGYHFVVLDACYRNDGEPYGRKNFDWTDSNIPAAEVEWLRSDLKQAARRAVVFVHQRLDVKPPLGIKNAPVVRKVLEDSRKVLAVLQGHDHTEDYKEIGGVRYCTLQAMVEGSGPENNAYAIMDIFPGDTIRIRGFRRQTSYDPL